MPESLLDQMARTSRARADASLAVASPRGWRALALETPPAPPLVLSGFDLVAECKLRAPSAGMLADRAGADAIAERARGYAAGGACAVSVLTEPIRFDGALEHLNAVAATCAVPAMRKDFLVDPVQLWEARAAGAGGALLIVRMLDDAALAAMLDTATEAGLFALVECFDAEDAVRAGTALADRRDLTAMVGVNTRDLRTLEVRAERLGALVSLLPSDRPWVAESGLSTPEDVAEVARLGYRLALVGTALMRAPDPTSLARDLIAAGRAACA